MTQNFKHISQSTEHANITILHGDLESNFLHRAQHYCLHKNLTDLSTTYFESQSLLFSKFILIHKSESAIISAISTEKTFLHLIEVNLTSTATHKQGNSREMNMDKKF